MNKGSRAERGGCAWGIRSGEGSMEAVWWEREVWATIMQSHKEMVVTFIYQATEWTNYSPWPNPAHHVFFAGYEKEWLYTLKCLYF